MNVLYFADPNSIHDKKWITYFSAKAFYKTYLLPRKRHYNHNEMMDGGINLLKPISDFSILRFPRTLITACRIKSIICNYKIDVIHILYAEPNVLWCIFRKYFGIPIVVSTRGTDVLHTIPQTLKSKTMINRFVGHSYKKAFDSADWITCTSQKQMDSVRIISNFEKKTSIIRTGVDIHQFNEQIPVSLPILKGKEYLLFPRYIYPTYNHEFCIKAIGMLPLYVKERYSMVFIGKDSGDPQYQLQLESLMKGIENVQFIFLEKQSQESMSTLYKNASVVVMTPLWDGSPVSAMEAIISGTKLIMGPLQYDEELFLYTSTILKKWDPVELKDTIVYLLINDYKPALNPNIRKLMDREYNMNKVKCIYNILTNRT